MAHPVLSTSDSIKSSSPSEASIFRDVGGMLAQYSPQHEGDKTRLVLQSFLNMHDCNSEQQLRDLANHLIFHIFTPLKAKSRTPSVERSPRPGWLESLESLASEITPSERQQKRLRKLYLERDGNRCVIYQDIKISYSGKSSPRVIESLILDCVKPLGTYCAFLLWIIRYGWASASWEAIWRAFPSMRSLSFGPDEINNPYNALTLAATLHIEFGDFSIALERTGSPNTYRIYKYTEIPRDANSLLPKSGTVTLTGTDQILAPHPVLLEAHAAVARILHKTAMAETMENVLRERELLPCLAFDRSTDVEYLLMAF